ncbi:2,5-dioxovalerate dehydrogenase [Haloferax gibbonsii]|uniref:aldehyde dehydrogenase (NAD(+)) n=1 Tax=Haloferax gibbonsii TaxID=35746 RepID=A0A0K1IZW6_HALGI|nr:aldehyde dehydrogenase family protein [Haloferax gibbonsii]AKU09840.1 aldehyde dehydrogenase [Haloferax gibbonsii]
MSLEHRNYIGGDWKESSSGTTFEVVNPANTSELVGCYQASTSDDTEEAIAAAVAQNSWESTSPVQRGEFLSTVARKLDERKQSATKTLVREEGKTRAEASGEVQRAIDIFEYYAQKTRDLGGTVKAPSGGRSKLYTKREPLGTVGLITPWNYPIAIPAWKIAPALATGNTFVLKPASAAPGPARILFECLDEAEVPDGVANMVTGAGSSVGTPLTTNSDIDAVSFTGSTAVGTAVAQSAAEDLTRVQCEMGGKNPTVVMPSADPKEAAEILGAGAFGTTGQSCTAASRAIVHEDVYDEFVDAIVEYAAGIEIGPGLENPDMGPHVNRDELHSTLEYVDIGIEEGAILETGGQELTEGVHADGLYIKPAVFSGVDNEMRIAQEEIFGPVLAVIEAEDFEHALGLANDVEYGLSASIVTQDYTEANEFVDRIEAGVAKVNEKTTGLELHVPFGGYKNSSTNTYREQGDAGIDFFTSVKTVYENY